MLIEEESEDKYSDEGVEYSSCSVPVTECMVDITFDECTAFKERVKDTEVSAEFTKNSTVHIAVDECIKVKEEVEDQEVFAEFTKTSTVHITVEEHTAVKEEIAEDIKESWDPLSCHGRSFSHILKLF